MFPYPTKHVLTFHSLYSNNLFKQFLYRHFLLGACDFYSIKLTRRPSAVVHLTIQDQHLQTIIEPKVLRFTERDWATAQLVCVSAIDDTDKSSESVETTMLEHVTASSDAQYNNLRFEVPVSISDNDGHYLWGFGSNHYRQFGVDEIGPGASLPG